MIKKELTKINFGCGRFPKKGYINVDINPRAKPDILMDLNDIRDYKKKFPNNNMFDEIICEHVLEHLDKPFDVMAEFHRILKPNGKLIIQVPHFTRGFTHTEHAHGFDVSFPLYFNKKFDAGYWGFEFALQKMKLSWMIRFDLKKGIIPWWSTWPLKSINAIINFFANIAPFFCSRIWCYWVGGFEQIEYIFVKKK